MEFRLFKEKSLIFVFLVMALLLIAGCSQSGNSTPEIKPIVITNPSSEDQADEVEVIEAENEGSGSELKTFTSTGENFKFLMGSQQNPDLEVSVGDTVRIEFTATSGFHDWSVEGFNKASGKVSDGQSTFVEFVADKKGTFEYYCSIGSHRQSGMKGKLIVS